MKRVTVILTTTLFLASCASFSISQAPKGPSAEETAADQEAKEQKEREAQAKAKSSFDAAYAKLNTQMEGIKTSTPTPDSLDAAKGDLMIVRAMLTSSTSWGASSPELSTFTSGVQSRLTEYKQLLEVRALHAEIFSSKTQMAELVGKLKIEIEGLKTSDQALTSIKSIETNFKSFDSLKSSNAKLASKSAELRSFIEGVEKRISTLQQDFTATRGEVYVAALNSKLKSSTKGLRTALNKLKANPKDATNFETVQKQLADHKESISAAREAKEFQEQLKKPLSVADALASLSSQQLTNSKVAYDLAAQKRAVKSAIEELKAITTTFETATDEAVFDQGTKALKKVEELLLKGKTLEAKDKAYAGFANGVRLGMKRGHAGIKAAKAKWPVRKQTVNVQKAATAASEALKALDKAPSEATIKALETALSAVTSALATGKALESKDLTYLRLAIAERKNVKKQEAKIKTSRAKLVFTNRKSQVETAAKTAKAQVEKAKNESEFVEAEKAIAAVSSELVAGKTLESKDLNYLKFANATRKAVIELGKKIAQSRQNAAVTAQKIEIEKAAEALKMAVAQATDAPGIAAADKSIKSLEQVIAKGKSLESKSPKYLKFVAAQKGLLAKSKKAVASTLLKNQDAAARIAVEQAFANAEAAVSSADAASGFKPALDSVSAFEKVLSSHKALEAKSKSYKNFATQKRSALSQQKKSIASSEKKAAVDAAKLAVEKSYAEAEALVSSATDNAAFDSADKAVSALEQSLSTHKKVESLAPAYLKYAKAKRMGVAKFKKSLVAARQKNRENAARIAVEQALANAQGQVAEATDNAGFTNASSSIAALQKALDDNKALESQSKGYEKFANSQRAAIKKQKRTVALAKKKSRVDAASLATEQAKANLESQIASATDETGFTGADSAIVSLEQALKTHKAVEAESPKYLKFAKATRAAIPSYKKTIKKARLAAVVNKAKLTLEQAQANADGLVASATDEVGFVAAEKAVSELANALSTNKELGAKSKGFEKYLKKQKASVTKYTKTIARARHGAKIQAARITVESSKAALDDALASATDPQTLSAATQAANTLQKALEAQSSLAKKDKSFGKYIAGLGKEVQKSRKAIARRQKAGEIQSHRILVEKAKAEAETSVESLSAESNQQAYQQAADAVSRFRKVLDEGLSLGDESPKYGKFLAKMDRIKNRLRAIIPRRRIEVAKIDAEIKITQLASSSEPGMLEAANEAVARFASITKANKTFSGATPEYKKFIKEMLGQSRGLARSLVNQRFVSAKSAIDTSFEALSSQPESEAYGPVERAIRGMDGLLREYSESESKSVKKLVGKNKASLAIVKTKLVKFRVEATKQRASALIRALDNSSVMADFSESREVLGNLTDVIEEAEGEIGQNKKLEKYLAGAEKEGKKLRRLLEAQKVSAALRPEFEKLDMALAKAKEQIDMLSGGDVAPEMVKAAASAVDAAETVVFDASKHDGKSKSFAKKRAKSQRKIDKYKLVLKKQERKAARIAHQISVEQAMGDAESKLASVEGSLELKVLDASMSSIKEARSVLSDGKRFKKNKKYSKYLGRERAKLAGFKTEAVKAFMRSSKEQMNAQVGALSASSDLQAFQGAQASIQAYADAIDSLDSRVEKSKKLKKVLVKARKRIPANRAKIMDMRVSAARSAVENQMEILRESKTEDAVDMARATNDVLAKTVKGLRQSSKKAKKNKKLKKLMAKVKVNRKIIAKYDFALKTKPHREQIKAATESAKASLEFLKAGSMDDKAFSEAEQAVEGLASVVNNVPVMARGSKKYEKTLNSVRKRVRSYRIRIAKYRNSGKIKIHKAQVAEAKALAKDAVKALSRTTDVEAYRAAEAAIVDLGRITRDGEELAERDRKYAKYLAGARKLQPKLRAQVTSQRLSGAFRGAKASLKRLEKSPTDTNISEASEAIDRAAKAVQVVSSYGKRGKKAGKEIKAAKKKVRRYRVTLAQAQTRARFKLLTAESEPEAFLAAEEAITSLRQLIKKNKKYAKTDKKLKKILAKAKKAIPKYRVRIKKRQIEVAMNQARENLAEAKNDPQAIALYEADESISDLEEALSAAKKLGKKNKKFGRFLRSAKKKAKKYRRSLVKVRLQKGSASGR